MHVGLPTVSPDVFSGVKMVKMHWRLGLHTDPTWRAQRSPTSPSWAKGEKGKEGKGKGGKDG